MKVGTMKQGRYRVLDLIGKGTGGVVYLAEDKTNRQHVALKLLEMHARSLQEGTLPSFQHEIETIARLVHPRIVPLLDHGEELLDGTLTPFVVMPYYAAGSLATWLQNRQNRKALSLQDVAYMLSQVADALDYAHEQGILHQDVKPSNFLLSEISGFQSLLLSDFRVGDFQSSSDEGRGQAIGSLPYMAPEQWQNQPVAASDQYALAVIVYLLLTGCPPFEGNSAALRDAHLHVQPAPPGTINPILSQGIDTVLLRALEKEPEERFPSISAFASAFEQIIQPMAAPAMVSPVPTARLYTDWIEV